MNTNLLLNQMKELKTIQNSWTQKIALAELKITNQLFNTFI